MKWTFILESPSRNITSLLHMPYTAGSFFEELFQSVPNSLWHFRVYLNILRILFQNCFGFLKFFRTFLRLFRATGKARSKGFLYGFVFRILDSSVIFEAPLFIWALRDACCNLSLISPVNSGRVLKRFIVRNQVLQFVFFGTWFLLQFIACLNRTNNKLRLDFNEL